METVESHKSPNECQNAREYLVSRFRNDDGPIKPSVVADDYGCGAGHIRNVLVDLVDEGVATRVGRGRYVATESADRYDQSRREGQSQENAEESGPTMTPSVTLSMIAVLIVGMILLVRVTSTESRTEDRPSDTTEADRRDTR